MTGSLTANDTVASNVKAIAPEILPPDVLVTLGISLYLLSGNLSAVDPACAGFARLCRLGHLVALVRRIVREGRATHRLGKLGPSEITVQLTLLLDQLHVVTAEIEHAFDLVDIDAGGAPGITCLHREPVDGFRLALLDVLIADGSLRCQACDLGLEITDELRRSHQ